MNRFGLEGAVALVSGAAGGIGRMICSTLSEAGARVIGIDLESGEHIRRCDVTNADDVEHLVADVAREYGSIDLVIHAAGITRDGVHWKLSRDDWKAVLAVNLDAGFFLMHACAPHLRRSDRGSAVLISSINGERGKFGQSNYAASKAGLVGFAKSAARELGRDSVRVNVVAPGMINTAMMTALPEAIKQKAISETALGRLGQAQDVADAVLFLVSDLARHITGQVLRVDGGQLMA